MFVVGLTGGIGCGKSAVSDRLAEKSVPIIDADVVAREVVAPGEPALDAIGKRFGEEVLLEDGCLNRPKLREIVFSDEKQRVWLEQLLHPIIRDRILQKLEELDSLYAVLASPLLLETDQHMLVNHVVVVDAPESLQIERTAARDNTSEDQVRAIIAAQMSREERLKGADTVFDNSGDQSQLDANVAALHKKLVALAEEEAE
ncbi:dephospho-CoA kinase [Pontibacterium granulatum]|uniref:dephospho-CoA kinase n=1 Tax=Pontibacterium granulatum TaxID=2036029 RepID=UPI00249C532E|nr:dephospho-CoA kinase [Pontibacterium granulatum]MDI3323624.1 dephospho-CoA kinase [Pontibacterium granulatum]